MFYILLCVNTSIEYWALKLIIVIDKPLSIEVRIVPTNLQLLCWISACRKDAWNYKPHEDFPLSLSYCSSLHKVKRSGRMPACVQTVLALRISRKWAPFLVQSRIMRQDTGMLDRLGRPQFINFNYHRNCKMYGILYSMLELLRIQLGYSLKPSEMGKINHTYSGNEVGQLE